jgi:hypothetical protein
MGNKMNKYVKALADELDALKGSEVDDFDFEIAVKDKDNNREYILCEVYFEGNSICASRDAVNTIEEQSKYIAITRVLCDSVFSLDWHINELYSAVIDDIERGDLYTLVFGE